MAKLIAAACLTVAAAAATITTAATTAETAWLGLLRLRGVHAESAALVVVTVKRFDRSVQLALVAERHECKSFGSAGFAVGDDLDPFNGAVSGKETGNVFFGSGVGQVAHINIHFIQFYWHHDDSTLCRIMASQIK